MHEAIQPTRDPGWVLNHEGYSVLTESAIESRFAFGNGFLGMRAARSISRGPTWVGWLGYSRWASWPRCYVAGLFDVPNASGAEPADGDRPQRASYAALLKNRRLLIFGACAALFQIASASMMPLLGGGLAYEGKRQAAPLIAALIIVPQVLVGCSRLGWDGRRKNTAASHCCSSGLRLYQYAQCCLP